MINKNNVNDIDNIDNYISSYTKLNNNYKNDNFKKLNDNIDILYSKLISVYNKTNEIKKNFDEINNFDSIFYNIFKYLFSFNLKKKINTSFNGNYWSNFITLENIKEYIENMYNKLYDIYNDNKDDQIINIGNIFEKLYDNQTDILKIINYSYKCNTNKEVYYEVMFDDTNIYNQYFEYTNYINGGSNHIINFNELLDKIKKNNNLKITKEILKNTLFNIDNLLIFIDSIINLKPLEKNFTNDIFDNNNYKNIITTYYNNIKEYYNKKIYNIKNYNVFFNDNIDIINSSLKNIYISINNLDINININNKNIIYDFYNNFNQNSYDIKLFKIYINGYYIYSILKNIIDDITNKINDNNEIINSDNKFSNLKILITSYVTYIQTYLIIYNFMNYIKLNINNDIISENEQQYILISLLYDYLNRFVFNNPNDNKYYNKFDIDNFNDYIFNNYYININILVENIIKYNNENNVNSYVQTELDDRNKKYYLNIINNYIKNYYKYNNEEIQKYYNKQLENNITYMNQLIKIQNNDHNNNIYFNLDVMKNILFQTKLNNDIKNKINMILNKYNNNNKNKELKIKSNYDSIITYYKNNYIDEDNNFIMGTKFTPYLEMIVNNIIYIYKDLINNKSYIDINDEKIFIIGNNNITKIFINNHDINNLDNLYKINQNIIQKYSSIKDEYFNFFIKKYPILLYNFCLNDYNNNKNKDNKCIEYMKQYLQQQNKQQYYPQQQYPQQYYPQQQKQVIQQYYPQQFNLLQQNKY